jgi:predicted HAD superfamily Cof-like phosphohydrolase
MNEYEKKVHDFHMATDGVADRPLSAELLLLRKTLISEEVKELFQEIDLAVAEMQKGSLKQETVGNLLKEMADVQYVLSGMAVTMGLPMQEVFKRVHDSNMSKLDENGRAIYREDGKILKGPRYAPPVLDDLALNVIGNKEAA